MRKITLVLDDEETVKVLYRSGADTTEKDAILKYEKRETKEIFVKLSKLVPPTLPQDNPPCVISAPSPYKFCAIYITFLLSNLVKTS